MDGKEVRWSSRAEQDFDDQINYLIQNWSVETAEQFIDQVLKVVDAIARRPFQYPAWQDDVSIRKCVVNPHIALFYQVKDEQIVLLTFFPTRQNPDKMDFSE